jgi:hypothetical protein
MHRYAQVTVYGETVRVRVNPGEHSDNVVNRARSRYLAKYYGRRSFAYTRNVESWNESGDKYFQATICGPAIYGSHPVRGVEHWCERAGTGTANRAAIVAAGGFDPLSEAA